MEKIQFKKLHTLAQLPTRGTVAASGLDLRAIDAVVLSPGERTIVGTGVAVELPVGFEGQIRPRSGLAAKSGITVLNTPGTIDADFRGELKVILLNTGHDDFIINSGDRIAQLVIAPVLMPTPEWTEELSTTDRGEGGFGSTGSA